MTKTKLFTVEQIFPILKNGKGNNNLLSDGHDLPYLGAKKKDNGVMRYCGNDSSLMNDGNCICFICNGAGSVGYSIYMDRPFIATSDLVMGYNTRLTPKSAMYLIALFDLERPKFSYGRKWKKTLRKTAIPLPATESDEIDWDAIENFITNLIPNLPSRAFEVWTNGASNLPISSPRLSLESRQWKWFRFDEIFHICKGFYNKKPEHNPLGDIPFIGATDSNNGITSYTDLDTIISTTKTGNPPNSPLEEKLFPGKCITVSNNGSVGYAFYQANQFTCSHDVNPLYLLEREMNEYLGLFLCSVISLDRYRWNYGRKWRPIRMPDSVLKLPVDKDGNPDWDFMERYIKSLPFSSNFRNDELPKSFPRGT